MMKAFVDQDMCIGCSLCESGCPAVFTMDGDKAVAITDAVPPEEEDAARQAADDCPVTAIEIRG